MTLKTFKQFIKMNIALDRNDPVGDLCRDISTAVELYGDIPFTQKWLKTATKNTLAEDAYNTLIEEWNYHRTLSILK